MSFLQYIQGLYYIYFHFHIFFGRMPGYDALVEELLTECEEANKPSPQAASGSKHQPFHLRRFGFNYFLLMFHIPYKSMGLVYFPTFGTKFVINGGKFYYTWILWILLNLVKINIDVKTIHRLHWANWEPLVAQEHHRKTGERHRQMVNPLHVSWKQTLLMFAWHWFKSKSVQRSSRSRYCTIVNYPADLQKGQLKSGVLGKFFRKKKHKTNGS